MTDRADADGSQSASERIERKSSYYRSYGSLAVATGNRESIWPTLGKEGYFFIYYPPLSLSARRRSGAIGKLATPTAECRGDDEIWGTWLDSERRHLTLCAARCLTGLTFENWGQAREQKNSDWALMGASTKLVLCLLGAD